MTWTDEKVERMVQLLAQGMSAASIGARIGMTRHAVISKIHRMEEKGAKLKRDRRKARPAKEKPLRKSSAKPTVAPITKTDFCQNLTEICAVEPDYQDHEPRDEGPLARANILEIKNGCRWPMERAPDVIGGYLFCNAPCQDGKSYCRVHTEQAKRRILTPAEKG